MKTKIGVINDCNPHYSGSSGGGSEIDYSIHDYIPFIQTFVEKNNISIVCDVGCGSCKLVEDIFDILSVTYYGYDCDSKIIYYNKIRFNEP